MDSFIDYDDMSTTSDFDTSSEHSFFPASMSDGGLDFDQFDQVESDAEAKPLSIPRSPTSEGEQDKAIYIEDSTHRAWAMYYRVASKGAWRPTPEEDLALEVIYSRVVQAEQELRVELSGGSAAPEDLVFDLEF